MIGLLKQTLSKWNKDHAPRLGAALAYYVVFSIGPLFLILIALLGLRWGRAAAEDQLAGLFQGVVGTEGAHFVQAAIAGAARPGEGVLAGLLGLGTLVLAALGVFLQLQDPLNTVWDVGPQAHAGWRGLVRNRILSFGMILVVGLLLLVSLVVQVAIEAGFTYAGAALPFSGEIVRGIDFFVSLAIVTVLFALVFKYLPNVEIAWRAVWVGALLTSFLFLIGRFALGVYLAHSAVADIYGAAGSLIALLTWLYYSAQILLFGAEFTCVYAARHARGSVPAVVGLSRGERLQP